MKQWLYLDDVRVPVDPRFDLVKNFDQFVAYIEANGIPEYISFDHDLGMDHIEYFYKDHRGFHDYDYSKLEKTGYHCARWLIEHCIEKGLKLDKVGVHSHNEVGAANIMSAINSGMKVLGQEPTCFRYKPPFIQSEDGGFPFEITSHGK